MSDKTIHSIQQRIMWGSDLWHLRRCLGSAKNIQCVNHDTIRFHVGPLHGQMTQYEIVIRKCETQESPWFEDRLKAKASESAEPKP